MSYIDARDHDRSGNHKKQQKSPLATTSISTGKSADNGTSSGMWASHGITVSGTDSGLIFADKILANCHRNVKFSHPLYGS